jgi:hypothetical protein
MLRHPQHPYGFVSRTAVAVKDTEERGPGLGIKLQFHGMSILLRG